MAQSLSTIFVDHLRPITDLLDGIAIGRLYLCGNRSLNSLLASVITRFELLYRPGAQPKQFPALLAFFPNLTALVLGYGIDYSSLSLTGVDWSLLPTGMRKMELCFGNALESLQRPDCPFPTPIPEQFEIKVLDLKQKWPNLEHISWSRPWVQSVPRKSQPVLFADLERLISVLPPTLRIFAPPESSKTAISLDQLLRLPRNLTELSISLPSVLDASWSTASGLFPATLVNVSLRKLSETSILSKLPRNLKTLIAMFIGNATGNVLEMVQKLPPALEYLYLNHRDSIGHLNRDVARALPRTLKTFGGLFGSTDQDYLANLPPGLTHLNVSRIGRASIPSNPSSSDHTDTLTSFAQLPRGLLRIPYFHELISHHRTLNVSDLPTELRELSVNWDKKSVLDPAGGMLPRNIKTLTSLHQNGEFASPLPRSITKLSLQRPRMQLKPSTIQEISSLPNLCALFLETIDVTVTAVLTSLRTSLKILTLESFSNVYALDFSLPWAAQLEHLSLNGVTTGITESWAELLPTSLTHLRLQYNPNVVAASVLHHLPNIKHLEIRGIRPIKRADFSGLYASTQLSFLLLTGSGSSLRLEDLTPLPWTLTAITIPSSPHLSADDWKAFFDDRTVCTSMGPGI